MPFPSAISMKVRNAFLVDPKNGYSFRDAYSLTYVFLIYTPQEMCLLPVKDVYVLVINFFISMNQQSTPARNREKGH